MDFGDFLASAYIVYRYTPLAHAQGVTQDFFQRIMGALVRTLLSPEGLEEIFWSIPENFRVDFLKVKRIFSEDNLLTPTGSRGNPRFCPQGYPVLTQREIKRYPKYDQMITQKTPNNIVAMLMNIFIELPLVKFLQALKNSQSLQ